MRKLETNDFEASNIEFVEFWMMDPFDEEDGRLIIRRRYVFAFRKYFRRCIKRWI